MNKNEPEVVLFPGELQLKPQFYYSIKAAAEKLGISRATVTRWKKEGKFPAPVLINGVERYRESDIEQMVALQNPGLDKDRLSGDIQHFINNQGA